MVFGYQQRKLCTTFITIGYYWLIHLRECLILSLEIIYYYHNNQRIRFESQDSYLPCLQWPTTQVTYRELRWTRMGLCKRMHVYMTGTRRDETRDPTYVSERAHDHAFPYVLAGMVGLRYLFQAS